ncbi:MAG TPA: hypothetical protein VGB15_02665 [Longimicrobium sp.]|jgi:hypothetical protein
MIRTTRPHPIRLLIVERLASFARMIRSARSDPIRLHAGRADCERLREGICE